MDIIKLNGISKSFGNKKIFTDYSLNIAEKEFVAITGKSGAGKSTLLNIMGLMEKCDKGEYEICGIKCPRLGTRAATNLLRTELAYLFQNFALINDRTVKYNLDIALKFTGKTRKEKDEAINNVLEKVGLTGYENKEVNILSGGEQQRIAFARIMLKPSRIIFADEPTGNLDHQNRDHVMNLLTELNKQGKTIIVVTHDSEVVKYAHRVIKL